MKKILGIVGILLSSFFIFPTVDASSVNMETISSPVGACSITVNSRYYLGDTKYPADLLGHSGTPSTNWMIGMTSTKVQVYNPNNNIQINGGFQYTSQLLPKTESQVVVMANYGGTKAINHPSSRDTLAAQIVYRVSVAPTVAGTQSNTFSYSVLQGGQVSPRSIFLENYAVNTSAVSSETECYNIYIDWCGDGVRNGGEQCDPNDPQQTGWGTGGCNSTCQPITTPPQCVRGSITLPLTSHITSTTPGLCPTGQTVGNFVPTTSGNTTTYTWTCNGLSGGNCTASYTQTPPPQCVRGSITLPLTAPITQTTPGLCPTGQTVANFVPTTSGNTTTYTWTCNGLSGGNCTASYTPTGQVSCDALTVTPSTGQAPLTSTYTCSGTNATSYAIVITNSIGTVIRTINASSGTHTINTAGTYTATCSVNGSVTSSACQQTVRVTTPPASCQIGNITLPLTAPITSTTPGLCPTGQLVGDFNSSPTGTGGTYYSWSCGGVSGGSCNATYNPTPQQCVSGGVTGSQSNPVTQTTPGLCPTGQRVGNFTATPNGNTTNYSWSCGGVSGGNCNASYTPGGGGEVGRCVSLTFTGQTVGNAPLNPTFTCQTSNSSQNPFIDVYRNGTRIHRVTDFSLNYTFNSQGNYQVVCHFDNQQAIPDACRVPVTVTGPGGSSGGSSGTPGSYCGDGILQEGAPRYEQCDFGSGTWPNWCGKPGDSRECKILGETTTPSGGNIRFAPAGTLLLGGGMSVLEYTTPRNQVTITNDSTSDIYIGEKLCIFNLSQAPYYPITGGDVCTDKDIGKLSRNGGQKILSIGRDHFKADTSRFPENMTYSDGMLAVTLPTYKDMNSFLRSTLTVRVARPSVSTFGGGASLVDSTKLSDINEIARGFTGSLLDPNWNKNMILASISLGTGFSSHTNTNISGSQASQAQQQGKKDTQGFNRDFTQSGAVTTASTLLPRAPYHGFDTIFTHRGNVTLDAQTISGPNKTYIIEDGNLTINGDITSDANILFVVKRGTIYIGENVTQIDAVLINIGGDIKATGGSTTKQLLVNGALYGNVDHLLQNRTYIKDQGPYVQVGTNINFTSKIFSSPPPLLSKFLGEYLEAKKVAK